VFARRTRRAKAVSKADLRDRLLILLVGLGQVVLPCIVATQPVLLFAARVQPAACTALGALAMAAGLRLFWRSHADLGDSWSVTLELNVSCASGLNRSPTARSSRRPMSYSSVLTLCTGWLPPMYWL